MANADQISRTISPGSLPQGRRQEVTAQLQQALGQGGGGAGAAPGASPAPAGGGFDPLQALMGGKVGQSELPVTSGLAQGPGRVPDLGGLPLSRIAKLQALAQHARSPVLRLAALDALEKATRGKDNQFAPVV